MRLILCRDKSPRVRPALTVDPIWRAVDAGAWIKPTWRPR